MDAKKKVTTPPYDEIKIGSGKLDQASQLVGSEMSQPSDWVEIHCTDDEWEAKLVQTTLEAQQIRCRPLKVRSERRTALLVEQQHQVAAMELVSRIGVAITDNEMANMHEEAAEALKQRDLAAVETAENQAAVSTDSAEVTLAEREGIGSVVYVPEQGYEIRVGPEPFITVPEDEWEEFTDFSAQRQEFVILLRHEYPVLFEWIQQGKSLAEFIRLIEMTYQEGAPVPIPYRHDNTAESQTAPNATRYNALAKLSLSVAVIALFAALFQMPWTVILGLSLVSGVSAIIAKSQIDASEGQVKGIPMAFSAILLACLAMVLAWWFSQRPPAEPENPPVRELIEDR